MVLTREQPMKDNTNTQKLSIWWPNAAVDNAEHDVLLMSTTLWNYKYGSVVLAPNADQLSVVSTATDPSDSYNFAWDN